MPLPSTVADLSLTPSANSPAGSDSPTQGDDYFRAHASLIKQVSDAYIAADAALAATISDLTVQRERQTATAGQVLFTLTNITYTTGIDSMTVKVNGIEVYDFTETSSTSVTLTTALDDGDEVTFSAGLSATPIVASDSAMVSFAPAGAGAVTTTVQAKLRESVSLADKGGAGDSTGLTGVGTDNVAALLNAATDAKTVRLGPGIWRFASEVQFTGPMRVIGEPPAINKDGTLSGTWLYFDHVGRGLYFRDGVSDKNYGAVVDSVGILRNQSAAGGGWAPTTCDYDIQTDTSHLTVRSVYPYRSTKFLNVRNAGTLTINDIRGQVFQEGIRLERTTDVARIIDVHFWPYWSQDSNVTTYMTDTLKGLVLQRADNPVVRGWFSIYSRHGFYIEETADGNTSKLSGSDIDFDQSDFGISIAAGATVTAKLVNVQHQAPSAGGRTTGNALNVLGDNCLIDVVGLECGRRVEEFVHIGGAGNVVTLTNPRAAGAATGGGAENYYTLEGSGAANTLYIIGPPGTYTAAYAATTTPTFTAASPHVVSYSQEIDWTPTLTFATPGDVAVTYATRVGKAKRVGQLVTAQFNIVTSAFTHTTASGNLRISGLPFTSANVTGAEAQGSLEWQGITKATYTSVVVVLSENASILTFRASGSAVSVSNVDATNVPTAGTVRLRGTITYQV